MATNPINQNKINNDPDYIHSGKFSYSVKKFLSKHPEGASPQQIADFLNISLDQYNKIYQSIILKLRRMLK